MKEPVIKLSELKSIYEELCQARRPYVQFDLDAEVDLLRQAIFAKDKAINSMCNFLYNKGIQSLPTVKEGK